jgi:hypothetical protein
VVDGLIRKLIIGNPEVTAAWILIILLAVISLFLLVGPGFRQRSRDANRLREASAQRRERLSQQASDDSRYASEVSVAAQRARGRELSLRERWLAMQEQTELAWGAYEAAETQLLRVAEAGAIPVTKETDEFCERELRRVVTAACLRGELSPMDLSEALQHQEPWDPHQHPADQEIALRRRIRTICHENWRAVAAQEWGAWEAYATAATQARSLKEEATAAVRRAKETEALHSVAIADRSRKATSERTQAQSAIRVTRAG